VKKTLFTSVLLLLVSLGFAQSNKEEVDLVQSIFGIEKKAMAAEFITLDATQKDAFWLAYDEYETKRKELGKKRIDLLNKYAASYTTMDDATADDIVNQTISLQAETDKLVNTYYKKIKKSCGVKPAAQFYQLESYVLSEIRAAIMENIPLIGALDKNK
jgi:hypothetical protein